MSSAEPYIDGIFNYCDRWCERCEYSGRCRVFAMDRSLAAWAVLRNAFLTTQPQDSVLDLLLNLDRLRRWTQQSFPDARAFVRPGLDDEGSP
jgi:hypothetical protein